MKEELKQNNMKYKALNIMKLPFRLIFYLIKLFFIFPMLAFVGFLQTDFEDDWDRNYFINEIKNVLKF